MSVLLRVWDLLFYEGSCVLFQITLAMIKLVEPAILACESSSGIFTILNEAPESVPSVDALLETSIRVASSVNGSTLQVARRKHQAYLMAQEGVLINPSGNYSTLPMSKERSRSTADAEHNDYHDDDQDNKNQINVSGALNSAKQLLTRMVASKRASNSKNDENNNSFAFNSRTASSVQNNPELLSSNKPNSSSNSITEEFRTKNIVQTELLVNLRRVILKIAHHFQTLDPESYGAASEIELNADYSIESHSLDHERYMNCCTTEAAAAKATTRSKRAKALLDFEKTDEDELGFRKNDLIVVLSTKDDHCWIG